MNRDLGQLSERVFDMLVIGGGIYGAYCAWDAAQRGLSVALVEKADFGSATSSNSFRVIHGGLRYLQHADVRRMRESIRERRTLMRIAPHLVHPLPFVIPTYHHPLRSKWALAAAFLVNDLIGYDRNHSVDAERRLPRGRVISRREYLTSCPGVNDAGVTGGAVWYDCQMHNSERLLLSVLRAAVAAGAVVANYVEVTEFLRRGNRVTGIRANDVSAESALEIRANIVVNATGPWVDQVLSLLDKRCFGQPQPLSKAMNLVVNRTLVQGHAVGVYGARTFHDDDAVIRRGSRLFFITPWHRRSLIGTAHLPYQGDVNAFAVTEEDVQNFLDEVNEAYPAATIKREEVTAVHRGLLPMAGVNPATNDVKLTKHPRILDHLQKEGINGIISVTGVKYTTARRVAQRAVDLACHKLGKKTPACRTAMTPVYGGEIDRLSAFVKEETTRHEQVCDAETMRHLIYNYGAAYPAVLRYVEEGVDFNQPLTPESPVIKAEIIHAVREEMALRLSDVILRRTELGIVGNPGDCCLSTCAEIMAAELGWDTQRKEKELAETRALFSSPGSVYAQSAFPLPVARSQRAAVCSTTLPSSREGAVASARPGIE